MLMLPMAHEIVHETVTHAGIGIGSCLAIVLSWHRNKSILLAAIHSLFSWIYVIYFALSRKPGESSGTLDP